MPRVKEDEPNTHRTMQVVNHIRSLIENGTLQPGDKIPPEREFARSLKISRASLRTGIGYLAAMGVMKIRHGVGTFVADGPPEFGKASLSLIGALHGFQSWQMFEARIILESHLAALAAERGKEEHHTALAEEVAEMFASMNSPADYLIHDLLFHRIVSQASGNPILAAIIETITSALYDTRRKTVERSTDMRESAEMHREDLSRHPVAQRQRSAQPDGAASAHGADRAGNGAAGGASQCHNEEQAGPLRLLPLRRWFILLLTAGGKPRSFRAFTVPNSTGSAAI